MNDAMPVAERLERLMLVLSRNGPRLSQSEFIREYIKDKLAGFDVSESTVSKVLRGTTTISSRMESDIHAIIDQIMFKHQIGMEALLNVADRDLIHRNRRQASGNDGSAARIPSVYRQAWLGVHYPTIRRSHSEDKISNEEIRTFILFYEDNGTYRRGFSIYGNSSNFKGNAEYRAGKLYLYGQETYYRNEQVMLILNEAVIERETSFQGQAGIISGVGQGGIQTGHIFSVKTYIRKLEETNVEAFRARLDGDASFKGRWCNRFRIDRNGIRPENEQFVFGAVDRYMDIISKTEPENYGDRIFVL